MLLLAALLPGVALAQTYTDNTVVAINDNTCFNRTLTVPAALIVGDLNVAVDITHTYRGDLALTLTSPLGTAINLTTHNGGTANNLRVIFDDSAGTAITADTTNHTGAAVSRRPQSVLTAVNGQNAVGNWTLRVCDDAAIDTGTLNSFSLIFTAASANLSITKTNTPGVNGNVDQAADAVNQGQNTVYTIVVANAGPAAANGAVLQDPASAGLTCATAICAASGGAACPGGAVNASGVSVPVASLQAGVAIPTLPNGGSVSVQLTCLVN